MYARLKPTKVLGKTLDRLNVSIINYVLGSSRPILGYSIIADDDTTITSGNINLDETTYTNWTTNDEILLEYVASNLNIEILDITKVTKTSEEFLKEDPNLETR
jgi:hypothetical protein